MKGYRWFSLSLVGVILVVPLALLSGLTQARQPASTPLGTGFTYQGQLKQDGNPVDGTCDLQFSLWDALSGGNPVGSPQSPPPVSVADGIFTVQLDFGSDAFQGDGRWLEIAVCCPTGCSPKVTLMPRQALTASPYALALPGLWTQPNATSPNLIGGYGGNWVTSGVLGATIGGGGYPGERNRITDSYGAVGGGMGNQAGDNLGTVDDAHYATVGGGSGNTASGNSATVGGGSLNVAAGSDATIGGGYGNIADDAYDTISGGQYNSASEWGTTIGGGGGNTADHICATIGGGMYNIASGDYTTVGGGYGNAASGHGAAVPGGDNNTASGQYSFAVGRRAKALHDGAFVWADPTDIDFSSTAPNQFLARATGGVGINTSAPIANTLTVGGDGVRSETGATTGVYGHATATSGTTYGVYGVSDSSSGTGVYGEATVLGGTTAGVLGKAATGVSWGVAGWNAVNGAGVGAWSVNGDLIQAYDGGFPGGSLRFKVDQAGNVYYDGTLTPFVALPSPTGGEPDQVSLYGLASTEVWFEDLGSGTLVEGRAEVVIDPVFAQTVALTQTYNIYLTATCQEPVLLFVSDKAADHFTVQGVGLDGQPSSCGFDYRLAAKRLGYQDLRLEAVDIPAAVEVEREGQP